MSPLRRRIPLAMCLVLTLMAFCAPSVGQQDDSPTVKRKVINRVVPGYPDMARSLNLRGNVKVEAVVGTNGIVRMTQVKGGHPILAEAAEGAVRKWKFEPAARETKETVEFIFEPPTQ